VAATRAVIEQEIDWPCQIERLYSDVNQGCRLGVSRAITWFFEQVEESIILEVVCVPHPDFFPYCATLLERYRHDPRVWSINWLAVPAPCRLCCRLPPPGSSLLGFEPCRFLGLGHLAPLLAGKPRLLRALAGISAVQGVGPCPQRQR
jgi:hypothetical protein